MDERITIPVAAKRARLTPAALYAAATKGDLETTQDFGRILVTLTELKRYQKETKIGRPKSDNQHSDCTHRPNGKPSRKK